MHHCLEINEVLRHIYTYIDDDTTLSALSRTCRTFSEPATDLIWETLSNLLPILAQLPCAKRSKNFEWYTVSMIQKF